MQWSISSRNSNIQMVFFSFFLLFILNSAFGVCAVAYMESTWNTTVPIKLHLFDLRSEVCISLVLPVLIISLCVFLTNFTYIYMFGYNLQSGVRIDLLYAIFDLLLKCWVRYKAKSNADWEPPCTNKLKIMLLPFLSILMNLNKKLYFFSVFMHCTPL